MSRVELGHSTEACKSDVGPQELKRVDFSIRPPPPIARQISVKVLAGFVPADCVLRRAPCLLVHTGAVSAYDGTPCVYAPTNCA